MTGVVGIHGAFYRIVRVLMTITLLAFMGLIFAVQTPAQTPTKERLLRGQEDSARQKIMRSGPGRNPFSLPAGIHLRSKGTAVPMASKVLEAAPKMETKVLDVPPIPPPAPLKIRAILITSQSRLALIDRHIVRVGESIQEEKILEIAKDYVVLGKGDKKRTLLLHQSPIHLTVEEK